MPRDLKAGMTGKDVKTLQSMLNSEGASPKLKTDMDFGPLTKKAVIAFQKKINKSKPIKKLKVDGIVGKNTRLALSGRWPMPLPVWPFDDFVAGRISAAKHCSHLGKLMEKIVREIKAFKDFNGIPAIARHAVILGRAQKSLKDWKVLCKNRVDLMKRLETLQLDFLTAGTSKTAGPAALRKAKPLVAKVEPAKKKMFAEEDVFSKIYVEFQEFRDEMKKKP